MGSRKLIASITCALFLATAGIAGAAPIFSDNFDSENPDVNYTSFLQWTVSEGTVDVIGSKQGFPDFYNFLPGNGLYVDLDGSTANAGLLRSLPINLAAGHYLFSFQLAGNQNRPNDENVIVRTSVGSFEQTFTIPWTQNFTTYTADLHLATPQTITLEFENLSNDYIGALLDNVAVTPVPEPGTILLMGAGFLGLALYRRRRTTS